MLSIQIRIIKEYLLIYIDCALIKALNMLSIQIRIIKEYLLIYTKKEEERNQLYRERK